MKVTPNIARLMSDEDRARYAGNAGPLFIENEPETEGPPYSADVLMKFERLEHKVVLKFIKDNSLQCIHAPTYKKVTGLPKGWPDFSLLYAGKSWLCEMKLPSGRLSEDQLKRIASLAIQGDIVHITQSGAATIAQMSYWLRGYGWLPPRN